MGGGTSILERPSKPGCATRQERARAMLALDCAGVIEAFALGWKSNHDDAKEFLDETKKFLITCAMNPDFTFAPSNAQDAGWVVFMSHSKVYTKWCLQSFGFYLHRNVLRLDETIAVTGSIRPPTELVQAASELFGDTLNRRSWPRVTHDIYSTFASR